MYKYTKTTKSCFTHENLKNKKLNINSTLNNNKIKNDSITTVTNNKIGVNKNSSIKKDGNVKLINKKNIGSYISSNLRNTINNNSSSNSNNKKKINDYFNTIVNDTLGSEEINESKTTKDLQLEIPESFKNDNVLLPPVNYNYQKAYQRKGQNKKQLHLATDGEDGKVILRKKGLSKSEIKKCLVVIYDDIMIDNYEHNQETIDKSDNNPITTIKTNNNLNKKLYNLFINEINVCYANDETVKLTKPIADPVDDEHNCQLKKSKSQSNMINKILDDIYCLNIEDASVHAKHRMSPNNIEPPKKHSLSEINPALKKLKVQKSLLSSMNLTHKTRKRKFSNSTKPLNVKQTTLDFMTKRQKTI